MRKEFFGPVLCLHIDGDSFSGKFFGFLYFLLRGYNVREQVISVKDEDMRTGCCAGLLMMEILWWFSLRTMSLFLLGLEAGVGHTLELILASEMNDGGAQSRWHFLLDSMRQ